MNPAATAGLLSRHRSIAIACVAWLWLAVAVCLQIRAGAIRLHGDLADNDPPAHFATGVLFHDYLLGHHRQPPMAFARCFYIQYPKVALGHWPPFFYVIETGWFLLFGVGIKVAMWLCAAIAAACALALYWRAAALRDRWHALGSCAILLALPIMQTQAWRVMSDILLAALIFLALGSLSDFLVAGRRRDLLLCVAWASAAILTKATGWLLLGPLLLAPCVTGRRKAYTTAQYWIIIFLTGLISAPFYVWASAAGLGYRADLTRFAHQSIHFFVHLPALTFIGCGLLIAVLPFAIRRVSRLEPLSPTGTITVIMMAWIVTQVCFIIVLPVTGEFDRFFVPAIAPALLLLTAALLALERTLASRGFRYSLLVPIAVYSGVIAACAAERPPLPSTAAYSTALAPIPVSKAGSVVLVESDATGEGAVIAAELERDRFRSSYVLRSTKILSSSDWNGYNYSLTYRNEPQVRDALSRLGVDYVIEDTSAPTRPDTALLDSTLRSWQLISRIPVSLASRRGELLTYRRTAHTRPGRPSVVIPAGPQSTSPALTCDSG